MQKETETKFAIECDRGKKRQKWIGTITDRQREKKSEEMADRKKRQNRKN